jgi:hypothetical protein
MIKRENIDLIVKQSAKHINPEPHIVNIMEWFKNSNAEYSEDSNCIGDAIGYYVNNDIKCYGKTVDGIHAVVFLGTPKEVSHFETIEFPKYIFEKLVQ